jgi:hypothetical protein
VVALQVAQNSLVGGRFLNAGEVTVASGGTTTKPCLATNPCVTVTVRRTDLPTFFARIWGSKQVAVGASATAEAYNPSTGAGGTTVPVAPVCVKPWLLPNMDPSNGGNQIFDPTTGAVNAGSNLLGWSFTAPTGTPMSLACDPPNSPTGDCTAPPPPAIWQSYPGNDDSTSFPHPTISLPTCSLIPTLTDYQNSIAGCVQAPIACNSGAVNIDLTPYPSRDTETAEAVNCLTHATAIGMGDTVASTAPPSTPFQFVAGAGNPIPGLAGNNVMVSDSLVTVPVFSSTPLTSPTNPVQIIGFVQLFLNPDGNPANTVTGSVYTTVVNLTGCGTSATGQPILGNGASPVAVRLISQ